MVVAGSDPRPAQSAAENPLPSVAGAEASGRQGSFAMLAELAGLVAGHLDAVMKSGVILARGLRGAQQAALGVLWMQIEDGAATGKAIIRSPTVGDAVHIQAELAALGGVRTASRGILLLAMTAEVVEEASFPLARRAWLTVDRLGRLLTA